MEHILAQKLIISIEPEVINGTPIPVTPIEINGPLQGPGGQPIEKIADIINIGIQFLFPLIAILVFFYMVWGGYDFLLSAGDPEKIKAGKGKITSAIIGFILLVMSYFITNLIARILGLGGGIF